MMLDLPKTAIFLLFMICFSVSVWTVAAFIRSFWSRRRAKHRILYGVTAVLGTVLIQFLTENKTKVPMPVCFIGVPVLAVLFTMVLAVTHGRHLKGIFNLFNAADEPGPGLIKECVDRLPMGIFCYYPDGRPKLVNQVMGRLAVRMDNKSLLDGNILRKELTRRSLAPVSGMSHIIRTEEGRIYNFQEKGIMFEDKPLREILANDVTTEYALTESLKEKEESVTQLNGKLKELADETLKTAIEKEVLDAKIKVHDNFGRVILFTRRYLRDPKDGGNASKIASEIMQQIILMKNESPDEWRRDYEYIYRTARLLGVTIEVHGELPVGGKQERLAVSALSCTLLNSARHAGADRMIVEVSTEGKNSEIPASVENGTEKAPSGYCRMRIYDNGGSVSGPITVKGGLVNLRRELEAEGGRMAIGYVDGVVVNIVFPM